MIRITGAKKGRGLTNAEAARRYGLAPILDADGNVATLHETWKDFNSFLKEYFGINN